MKVSNCPAARSRLPPAARPKAHHRHRSERESLLESIDANGEKAVVQARSLQKETEQTYEERKREMLLAMEAKERTSAMRRTQTSGS